MSHLGDGHLQDFSIAPGLEGGVGTARYKGREKRGILEEWITQESRKQAARGELLYKQPHVPVLLSCPLPVQ